ncbi:tail fiber protein [Escherichia phage SuperGirl]|uniref:Tail fiber protein n=1 Tax=Escherichia phage SuperGirl TaxID=2851993 RepID=A0AAE7VZU5_9CAUD|nr:tail fiber protein [Escherichia phage SuperGirl]
MQNAKCKRFVLHPLKKKKKKINKIKELVKQLLTK